MKRLYIILWHILFLPLLAFGQNCGLEDTLYINPESTHLFNIEIADVVNDDLSDPEQGLCGVEIEFVHQFSENLELWLISPGGDTVYLIGPNTDDQLAFTFFANWDISFVPCGAEAMPDSAYLAQWTNDGPNNFVSGGQYDGSYYPYAGCLEDFDSGPVNGAWQIYIENMPSAYAGAILDFRLIFCDMRGIDCCFANPGQLDQADVLACEGDTSLMLDLPPAYSGLPADTSEYDYTYAIGEGGMLLSYDSIPDLSSFPPGQYEICGLSFKKEDRDSFPAPDGMLTIDSIRNNLNSFFPTFCGALTDSCVLVTIVGPPAPTQLMETICEGDSIMVGETNFLESGSFSVILTGYGGCDSLVNLELTVIPTEFTLLEETICAGDSVVVGSTSYTTTGLYLDTLAAASGCDSLVNLNLTVLSAVDTTLSATICQGELYAVGDSLFTENGDYEVVLTSSFGCDSTVLLSLSVLDLTAMIAPPEVINCFNEGILLDGSGSSPAGLISYEWTDSDGTILGNDPSLNVDTAGLYILHVGQMQNGTFCTDSDSVAVADERVFPTADAGLPDTLTCAAPEITIGGPATSTGPDFTYLWNTDTGHFTGVTDDPSATVDGSGNYTLTVTDLLNGCTDSAFVFIAIDTLPPVAEAGPDAVLNCEQQSLVIDGAASSSGASITYDWVSQGGIVPAGADTSTPLVEIPDTYFLTVLNESNGCSSTDTLVVSIDTIPPQVIIAMPPLLNCSVVSQQLDATASDSGPDFAVQWTAFNGGNITGDANTLTPSVDAPGNYELLIINTDNNCRDSAQVTLSDTLNTVVADAGPDSVLNCDAGSLVLSASASSSGPDIIYCWSSSDGNIVGDSMAVTISINTPGTYQLIVTDTFTLCADTAFVLIEQDTQSPVSEAGPGGLINCNTPELILDGGASSAGPEFVYLWSGPCLLTDPTQLQLSVNCPGVYYLTTTNTANGCSSQDSTLVAEDFTLPGADAGPDTMLTCGITEIVLDGSASVPSDSISYQWTGPGIINGSDTAVPTVGQPGLYSLIVAHESSFCTDTAFVQVGIDTIPPMADAGPDTTVSCGEPQIALGGPLTTIGPGMVYQWFTNEGRLLGAVDMPNALADTSGVYVLIVTDTVTACADTSLVTVEGDYEPPFADAGPDQEIDCGTEQVLLNGSNSAAGPEISYLWSGPCLLSDPMLDTMRVSCDGLFTLQLTDEGNGCTSLDTVLVELDSLAPVAIVPGPALIDCETGTAILDGSASSPGSYQWLLDGQPAGLSGLTPTVSIPGAYTLIVSDLAISCSDSTDVMVFLDCDPVAVIAQPAPISCMQEIVALNAQASTMGPQMDYLWVAENPSCIVSGQGTPVLNVNCAGLYTLILTNTAVQLSDTISVTVATDTVQPLADAGLPDTLTCTQQEAFLDGSASSTGPDIVYLWTNLWGDTISTDPTVTVNEVGPYFLEVTDTSNMCSAVDVVQVGQDATLPVINFGSSVFPCLLDTFGLQAFVTPAGNNYSYAWTGPGIVANADSLQVLIDSIGQYQLMVTNMQTNCSAVRTINITEQICVPCLEVSPPDTLNCLIDAVTLSATFCEPCAGCEVEWTTDNGEILQLIDSMQIIVSAPGTYTLRATDTLGFTTTLNIPVVQDILSPAADAGPDRTLTCDSLELLIGGPGTPVGVPYLIQWTAAGDQNIDPVDAPYVPITEPGIFFLEVVNGQTGCIGRDTVIVSTDTLPPLAEAGADQTLTCDVNFVALDGSGSSLGDSVIYQWTSPQNPNISGAGSLNPLVGVTGAYYLAVTDTVNGCMAVDSTSVLLSDSIPVIPEIPDTSISCLDSMIVLMVSLADTTNLSFLWCPLDENGQLVDTACVESLSVEVSQAGNYRFELTDNDTGCSNVAIVAVEDARVFPEVEAGLPDTLLCNQESLQLIASAGPAGGELFFQWVSAEGFPIDNPNTLTPTVYEAGAYVLFVTDNNSQCTGIDSVTVALDEHAPVAEAGPDTLIDCTSSSLQLSGSGESASGLLVYNWEAADGGNITGGAGTSNPQIDQPGTYYLSVTDPQNGCMAIDSLVVSDARDYPAAQLAFPFDSLLNCSVDTLIADASSSEASGAGPLNYEWNVNGAGSITGSGNVVQIDAPGNYQLIVRDESNACRDTLSFQIGGDFTLPLVGIAETPPLSCIRQSVILDASGSSDGPDFALSWTGPGGDTLTTDSLAVFVDTPGMYLLQVVNLENGCSAMDSVSVGSDLEPPVAVIEEPELLDCTVREVLLNATASSQGGDFTYAWTSSGGTLLEGQDSILALAGTAALYQFIVTNMRNGCQDTATVEVLELEAPITALDWSVQPPDCYEQSTASLTIDSVSGGTPPFAYSIDGNFFSTVNLFEGLASGSYLLRVQDASGCEWEEEVFIPETEELMVDLGVDITMELGDSVLLKALVNTDNYENLQWEPASAFVNPGLPEQYVKPEETSVYTVTVFTAEGCRATDRITVNVIKPRSVFIPNIFSPNGDGKNDRFLIFAGKEVLEIRSFRIFDRWGNQVFGKERFQANDPTYGWDGNFNGRPMNTAVFAFFAEVEFIDGRIEMIKGDVILMR